jgi:hypothetical protein
MITVIVTYQVKPGFAEQNKSNIQRFLEDFRKLDSEDFQYNVYTKADDVTFVHYSSYRNEEVQTKILDVPSFKEFQRLRDESGLNGTHKVEVLNHIGSSTENFS